MEKKREERIIAAGPPPKGWPSPMREEALHGLPGEIVKTVGPHSESDPIALLVQMLVAFGNIIGRRPHYMVEADRHSLNLFAALIGPTGKARKGTSWGQVERMLDAVDPVWRRDQVQRGLASGEGIIRAVWDGTASEPGVTDKRMLVFESEFGGTLRVMARPGNTLSKVLRQAWDGGTLQTITRRSPLRATNAHLSVIAQTTTEDLARYLDRTDMLNGFANRFLWVCVRRSKLLPHGGQVPQDKLQVLTQRLQGSVEFGRRAGRLKFSEKAGDLWAREYGRLTADVPGLLGKVTSRGEAQVSRLAAIYALMERLDEIRIQHLRAALAVWTYCFDSARFIFGGRSATSVEDKLLQILRGTTVGLTRTEISSAFHRHVPNAAITSALKNLREQGLVKSRKESTGGRSAEHWSTAEGGQ